MSVRSRLGSRLGAGGTGEVYRARDSRLHRDVALKVLPEHLAADRERLARFEREAQVLPRHSALVRVTHWVTALSTAALVVSGIAILLAHPRLYWGETGAVRGPSLIDLPLPFVLVVDTLKHIGSGLGSFSPDVGYSWYAGI